MVVPTDHDSTHAEGLSHAALTDVTTGDGDSDVRADQL